MTATASAGRAAAASILRIDLAAIAANYRLLKRRLGAVDCAAAVKADAYGAGAARVAPALAAAGCRTFFVATVDEGVALRASLPDPAVAIAVLNGLLAGCEAAFLAHGLTPVLNDPGQIALWRAACAGSGRGLDAMLHVDTGMNRLGLAPGDVARIADRPDLLAGPRWRCLISHLACADDPDHRANGEQLARFQAARAVLPPMPASLANSGGVFLGPDYHFDLARPGIALYGGNPQPARPNPMRQVVCLFGRVLQVREVASGATVGYGGAYRAAGPTRVATVAAGYADGYIRAGGGRARVGLGALAFPVIGRISMDLITVDVSQAPPGAVAPGTLLELLGDRITPDLAADAAGTISYEILTSLGSRYHRDYVGADDIVDITNTEESEQ